MTELSFDRLLTATLADGPGAAPMVVVDRAIAESMTAGQRRARFPRLDAEAWPPRAGSIGDPTLRRNLRVVLIAATVVGALAASAVVGMRLLQQSVAPLRTDSLVSVGQLPSPISFPLTLALHDGRLLIGGDSQGPAIAVVFDPATGTSTPIDAGLPVVALQAVQVLPDGRVFLIGWHYADTSGAGDDSRAWLYDPETRNLSAAIPTLETRFEPAVASLPDGRVVVLGGQVSDSSTSTRRTTEIFDPASLRFVPGPDLPEPRYEGLAAGIPDGRVLLAGGFDLQGSDVAHAVGSVVLFDPLRGTSRSVGVIGGRAFMGASAQSRSQLVRLSDGRILLVGRQIGPQTCGRHGIDAISAQIFDPGTGALVDAPPIGHGIYVAVGTLDGRVVVAGQWSAGRNGCETDMEYVSNAWVGVYDPVLGLVAETRDPFAGTRSLLIDVVHRYTGGALLSDGRIALVSDDNPADGQQTGNSIDLLSLAPR